MTPDEMADILAPRPFRPVRVLLKDGRHYDIMHPQLKLIVPGNLVIGLQRPWNTQGIVADDVVRLDWDQIDRVEVIPNAEPVAAMPPPER